MINKLLVYDWLVDLKKTVEFNKKKRNHIPKQSSTSLTLFISFIKLSPLLKPRPVFHSVLPQSPILAAK